MRTIEVKPFLFCEVDGDGHWVWDLLVAGTLVQVFVDDQLDTHLSDILTTSYLIRRKNL